MSRIVTLPTLSQPLPDGSKSGGWWHEAEEAGRIVCDLCPRACSMKPGDRGFCFVRENRDGQMVLTTYGRSTGFCIDPIEKKPLNHFYPGTAVLSFGTAGCNLGCKFCQNWSISKSREVERLSELATPEAIAQAAKELGCRSVAFTYNDPVIWAEYAIDVARACHAVGLKTVAVTAGYITEVARQPFFEVMDAANVDLKAFTEEFYQKLTLSHIQPVLDTLQWLKSETNVWFEITNLVIPQENDSDDEFRRMCQWILEHVGEDVPLHFTAFHPDFRLRDRPPTPPETLLRGYETAIREGIKHAYVGNVHDETHQSTYCPHCSRLVIERDWYQLGQYHLENDRCRHCGGKVSGRFEKEPGNWGRRRLPVQISKFVKSEEPAVVQISNIGNQTMSPAQTEQAASPTPDSPPNLTPDQEQAIHRAACKLVASSVMGYRPEMSDPNLSDAASQEVSGCFVTLKRQGRLRACCGFLGRRSPLGQALQEAAVTTATRDARLPSISPTELNQLSVSVSLLHSFVPIQAKGAEREREVQVGRHGLQISQGQARGLLLPSVAVENKLTADKFLQQVCMKAGLPPTAWKDDDTVLATFEGHSVDGQFEESVLEGVEPQAPILFQQGQLQTVATTVRNNVVALLTGATPTYYLPNCPDGQVQGITLTVNVPGVGEMPRLSQLSIRPGIPLQSTLQNLASMAARGLAGNRLDPSSLQSLVVNLAVLYDPAMHGTVGEPDLTGIDPRRRAILVKELDRSAWVFDPALSAEEAVAKAASAVEVTLPDSASILSFEIATTQTPVSVTAVPRPRDGADERPPAVAGTFYPGNPDELNQLVDQLLDGDPREKVDWPAAMVPHAGLQYSGRVAADVLRGVEIPETVIVIGPKHTRLGVEWAVAPHKTWQLPSGAIESDRQLAQELVDAIPGLQLDASAHEREHAIEVELPLLARLAPQSHVVGIAIGSGNLQRCRQFATGLADVLRKREDRVLLLISSDMNHFASDIENRRLDEMAMSALEGLDPEEVFDVVRGNNISMCGVLPAVIVLETLRQLGKLKKAERVSYATSADVTGDKSRVVGYAGMLFG